MKAAAAARKILTFLSTRAFDQRARDRERRQLASELADIARSRAYNDAREPIILKRSAELNRLDSEAAYETSRKAARRSSILDWTPRAAPTQGAVASTTRGDA